ncbi:MAG: deoxyguanosinetriphosphate triphosphohydrolase-like protein [bacterium ADurb.BinA186]|nr:MAG: deoxyguanosinetriphosphate triphosphohydrolase-like protein [bacterium ADurb.BinA186]
MRLRGKTQLFNASADDHYHTRLIHTLEVTAIALELSNKKVFGKIDRNKVLNIALLHDIGHTPYGHAGERALHSVLAGKSNPGFLLPNLIKLDIPMGFKHNINSAFLYKTKFCSFSDVDPEIFDGILKHTSTSYENETKLDYGFETAKNGVFSSRFIAKQKHLVDFDQDYFHKKEPLTKEGLIVEYADEIAQICSDYLDLVNSGLLQSEDFCSLSLFKDIPLFEPRHVSNLIKNKMLRSVGGSSANSFDAFSPFSACNAYIEEFSQFRKSALKSLPSLSKFDRSKGRVCQVLFAFYYCNPRKMGKDVLKDLCNNLKMPTLSTSLFRQVQHLDGDSVLPFLQKNFLSMRARRCLSSNCLKKSQLILLKVYLRTIATYISTMTDSYADHRYKRVPWVFKSYVRLTLAFQK